MRDLIVALALVATVLVSCNKEFEDKPLVNAGAADWKSVPASGGLVEVDEICLEFPSGAFSGGGKVAVTPVPKGTVKNFGKHHLSQFYQVLIPKSGTARPFTISFNYSGDAKKVQIVEQSPRWYRYHDKVDYCVAPLETSYDGAVASAEFPEVCATEGEDQFFIVGLIEDIAARSSASTKAGTEPGTSTDKPSVSYLFRHTMSWDVDNEVHKDTIVGIIELELPKIEKIYTDLGFEFSANAVPYIITADFNADNWGEQRSSKICSSRSAVYLNVAKFYDLVGTKTPNTELLGQLQQTLIHETFHWLHESVYDTRWGSTIGWGGIFGTSTSKKWQYLSEAIATWLEKFTGNKMVSDLCPRNIKRLSRTMLAAHGKSIQDHGYGAGYFIEWLASKTSDKKIVDLLKLQRDGKDSPRAIFDAFLKTNKQSFFDPPKNWHDFMFSLFEAKTDPRLPTYVEQQLLNGLRCYKVFNLPIGEIDCTENTSQKSDDYDDGCDDREIYNFGMAVQPVKIDLRLITALKANPALSIVHKQEVENLRTWVCTKDFKKLGYAVKDTTCALNITFSSLFEGENNMYVLVTERKKQDTDPLMIKSKVTADVLPVISHMSFSAEKGPDYVYGDWSKQKITVTRESKHFRVEAKNDDGSSLSFTIRTADYKFSDLASVQFKSSSNQSVSVGSLKLDSFNLDSKYSKYVWWKGTYQGKDVSLYCSFL